MSKRKEVASLAGVSEATVSRVMNGIGPMKDATRKRVLEAAQTLDYQLNAIASSFARGKSGNLGVVVPRVPKIGLFSTYYFSEILNGIGDAVHEQGYGLLLLYRDPHEEYDYLSLFRAQRIDACIILGASFLPSEKAGIEKLAVEKLPFCTIDHDYGDERVSMVTTDHREGSYRAVKHLIRSGYERIGFLNGSPQYSSSQARHEGYLQAMREAGHPIDETLFFEGNYSRKSGYEASAKVNKSIEKMDAIAVANDRMTIGLIQGLRDKGRKLPQELPMVGYDDSDLASMMEIPLTTVRVPFYRMGYMAGQSLLERFPRWYEDHSIFHEKLQTELVIRKSCQKG